MSLTPGLRLGVYEIFYVAPGGVVMTASVNGQGKAFEVGGVQRLFEAPLR